MNRPKKVENEQTMAQIQNAANSTGSAWNKGGTWENKKIKMDQLKQYLVQDLVESTVLYLDDRLLLTEVESVSGDCEIIMVRNKRKINCDLTMKLKLEGQGEFEDSSVTVDFTEFGNDGCDPETELTFEGDKDKELKEAFNKGKVADQLVKAILDSMGKYATEN